MPVVGGDVPLLDVIRRRIGILDSREGRRDVVNFVLPQLEAQPTKTTTERSALPPAPAAPPPKPVVKLARTTLERYAGRYRAKDGVVQVLDRRGYLLVAYEAGMPPLEFVASRERQFFYAPGNDDLTFERDGTGVITDMRIYPDGKAAGKYEFAARE